MFAALAIKDKLTRASGGDRETKIAVLVEVFEIDFPKLGVDESWSSLASEALTLLQQQDGCVKESKELPFEIGSYKNKLKVRYHG